MKVKRKQNNIPKIVRATPPKNFRDYDEISAAYSQVGDMPNRNTRSIYRDINNPFYSDEV